MLICPDRMFRVALVAFAALGCDRRVCAFGLDVEGPDAGAVRAGPAEGVVEVLGRRSSYLPAAPISNDPPPASGPAYVVNAGGEAMNRSLLFWLKVDGYALAVAGPFQCDENVTMALETDATPSTCSELGLVDDSSSTEPCTATLTVRGPDVSDTTAFAVSGEVKIAPASTAGEYQVTFTPLRTDGSATGLTIWVAAAGFTPWIGCLECGGSYSVSLSPDEFSGGGCVVVRGRAGPGGAVVPAVPALLMLFAFLRLRRRVRASRSTRHASARTIP
jgi:hypothetical protein